MGLAWNIFTISKNLVVGIGLGLGIGYLVKMIRDGQKKTEYIIVCLHQLTKEIEQLKEALDEVLDEDKPKIKKKELKFDAEDGMVSSPDHYLSDTDEEEEFFDTEKGFLSREPSVVKVSSEDFESLTVAVDRLQEGNDGQQEEAYSLLITENKRKPPNADLLWRLARAQYQVSMIKGKDGDTEAKQMFMLQGVNTAEEALSIDESNANAHKWYAILVGNYTDFQDTKDKILSGYKYKKHIERSIELAPNDASSRSLLGRWCFEVYMLPWYMRKAAATLFAEPPTATVEEALAHFLQAEKISPGFWTENTLHIGKCYYQMWDYENAKKWFQKTMEMSSKSIDDEKAIKEAGSLFARC